jgi:hypothetical protein
MLKACFGLRNGSVDHNSATRFLGVLTSLVASSAVGFEGPRCRLGSCRSLLLWHQRLTRSNSMAQAWQTIRALIVISVSGKLVSVQPCASLLAINVSEKRRKALAERVQLQPDFIVDEPCT